MSTAELTTPAEAIRALCEAISPVSAEQVPWHDSVGRVLAEPVTADRDSPPCDVSAMDGYAVRLTDLATGELPISAEARIGRPALDLPPGSAIKIVTGAPVPPQAQAVVRREDTLEASGNVQFQKREAEIGQNIRRQGENLRQGDQVVSPNSLITPAVVGTLAAFGLASPQVYRKVRIGIITTGDELLPVDSAPEPWRIRDTNGPFLQSLLGACPRLQLTAPRQVQDNPARLSAALAELLDVCDAVILTGGVSMGDYDHVPAVIAATGARTLFHRLPVRPGHPILGAVGRRGQLVLGLPGNPLAVMTGMCRIGRAALAKLAGLKPQAVPSVKLLDHDGKLLHLWWYRPVTLDTCGAARLVSSRGSGDIPSAGRSDGFIELPPNASGTGPWPFFRWEI